MRQFGLALALTACLTVSGCAAYNSLANSRVIDYKLIKVETITDPETGETVTLSYWRYDDGVEVTTRDRFKKDTPVEARRATSRPGLRFTEAP